MEPNDSNYELDLGDEILSEDERLDAFDVEDLIGHHVAFDGDEDWPAIDL